MRRLAFATAIAAAISLATTAQAQRKLKFAVFTPDAEMTHQTDPETLGRKGQQESGGTLDIQTFANGSLGRNPALQTKMIQDGVADIAWVIPSYTPGVYLDDDVFELPNVIQDSTEGSVASVAAAAKGNAARLRAVLHGRSFRHVALYVPHQFSGAQARRPQGQEDSRCRHHIDGCSQGSRSGARRHAGDAGCRSHFARRHRWDNRPPHRNL